MRQIGSDYGVPKSIVYKWMKCVEITLEKWNKIQLHDIKIKIKKAEEKGINVETIMDEWKNAN